MNFKISFLFLFFLLLLGCKKGVKDIGNAKADIYIVAIENKEGWGFEIFKDNRKYIVQEHIPAVSGLQYFETKKEALSVGELMKFKIESNKMPPTITIEELDSLHIKHK